MIVIAASSTATRVASVPGRIDVLHAGFGEAQVGTVEQALQSPIVAGDVLGIDEQAEAIVEVGANDVHLRGRSNRTTPKQTS